MLNPQTNIEKDNDEAMGSVLFDIKLNGNRQFVFLNSPELSAFPNEQEVVLQEGIQYFIKAVDQIDVKDDKNG